MGVLVGHVISSSATAVIDVLAASGATSLAVGDRSTNHSADGGVAPSPWTSASGVQPADVMYSTPMDHLNQNAFAAVRNVICVLSIIANTGSIVSLRYCKKPGPLHAKLLVSLALSDLVIALVVVVKYVLDEFTLRWRDDLVTSGVAGVTAANSAALQLPGNVSTGMIDGGWYNGSSVNGSVWPPVYGVNVGIAGQYSGGAGGDGGGGGGGGGGKGQAYIGETHAVYCVHMVLRSISVSAMNITLLNLLGMSIDHHIAVNRPLSYTRLMSPRRTSLMISIFVVLGILLGFGDMLLQAGYTAMVLAGVVHDPWFADNQFCDRVDISPYHDEYAVMVITAVCLVAMTVVYINICIAVRRLSMRARLRRSTITETDTRESISGMSTSAATHGASESAARSKARAAIKGRSNKAIATTALLLVAFAVCWVPLEVFQVYMMFNVQNLTSIDLAQKIEGHLLNLTLLNTAVDPLIYALRMHEVRAGYRRLWAHVKRVLAARKLYHTAGSKGWTTNSRQGRQNSSRTQRATLSTREGSKHQPETMELMKKNSVSNEPSTVVIGIHDNKSSIKRIERD